jgi:hypothetical protein
VSAPSCSTPAYARRRPETTLLYCTVQAHLETFLARRTDEGRPVPRFVERELRAFLDCGLLPHGFVRVRCTACGAPRLVAFSCKGRGFCPSCGTRRMSDTAAHLVDRVLPEVPVRQWVLSIPYPLRYRLAYDADLCTAVLTVFLRAVLGALRRRARTRLGIPDGRSGAVTYIQRFGSAINLNVHFHTLALDGVFTSPSEGEVRFHPLPPPTDLEVARIVDATARRILRCLERRGDPLASQLPDPLAEAQPLLAGVAAASLANRIATGPRAGKPVVRLGDRIDPETVDWTPGERCARSRGFSLHAGVSVPGQDRKRLERLCRYIARPPIARERLTVLDDGRLAYRLRHPWRDGTTHFVFEPLELIEKLVALVPRPRANLLRYHGVLAPNARLRRWIVPGASRAPDASRSDSDSDPPPAEAGQTNRGAQSASLLRPRRLSWADLMRRVFERDVLECPDCGGRMRVLATITQPSVIRAILECLGLSARPPPLTPARPAPQPEFDMG